MMSLTLTLLLFLNLVLAARSPGCGKSATIKSQTYSTTINGKSRQYIIRLPNNYNNTRAYRLIFTWHQLGSSASSIAAGEDPNKGGVLAYYGLPPLANESAIFVVPNGISNGWANSGGEDVSFYDKMRDTVENDLCVDTSLRFHTGFSYGGGMSFAIACARGKETRAVAVISGSQLSGCAGGNDGVAYYGQHGTKDSVLPVANGRALRDKFVKNNGCTAVTEPSPGSGGKSVKTVYKGCKEGLPLTWVIHGGDHNPSQTDSGSSKPFAPGNSWEFFEQFKSV
jgi:poly(3-hydroxybutyrate) depolymerase